ncbi:MAG: Gfo/Idh/MocA family oxidoreductase [Deltaproteobacteria bacterium]|nr:Gfo/Idh/MocA family oxidoreductase [Deltaproteobacteria bacterium]
MSTLRFGLIGCGRISKRHAEVLKSLPSAELVAACDIRRDRAERFGREHGVPCYLSAEEMLDKEQLDVVNILTPSGNHADIVIAIAGRVANIIVEKPMALRLDDADRMIAACDESKTRLFVVKQNRYNVPVVKLREAVEEGRFGKMVMGTVRVRWTRTQEYYDQDEWRGTWAMDGGVLANQASHHIDLLVWMMGEVESVMAMTATRLVDIETEDTGVVLLRFRDGALGVIEATNATRPKDLEGSISILGERGTVEIGGFAVNEMKIWNFENPREEDGSVLERYRSNPPDVYGFGHYEYIKAVIDAIREERKALVDGLEGRKSLELINAIYESVETHREVFLRFKPQKCKLGTGNRNGL